MIRFIASFLIAFCVYYTIGTIIIKIYHNRKKRVYKPADVRRVFDKYFNLGDLTYTLLGDVNHNSSSFYMRAKDSKLFQKHLTQYVLALCFQQTSLAKYSFRIYTHGYLRYMNSEYRDIFDRSIKEDIKNRLCNVETFISIRHMYAGEEYVEITTKISSNKWGGMKIDS